MNKRSTRRPAHNWRQALVHTRSVPISHRTKVLVINWLTSSTVGQIDAMFSSHELPAPVSTETLDPKRWACVGSSVRRELAARYHAAIDPSDRRMEVQLLRVYDEFLADEQLNGWDEGKGRRPVVGALKRDGITFDADGRIAQQHLEMPPTSGVAVSHVALANVRNPAVLKQHLERLDRGADFKDPADVILTARELIESACHIVIEAHNDKAPKDPSLGQLYGQAADHLGLKAAAVPGDTEASKAAKQVLQSLASMADGMGRLRTRIGRGHGGPTVSPAEQRHAQLARNAALTLVTFVLATWEEREAAKLAESVAPGA